MKNALRASLCLLAASPAIAALLDGEASGQTPLMQHAPVSGEEGGMPLARLDMAALTAAEREGIRSLLSVSGASSFELS